MSVKKGDLLVENMCRFYKVYWSKHNVALTYLFLDCWILALYNHIPLLKEEIDKLPDCRSKCYRISSNWNKPYSKELYTNICSNFFVNKLTYKGVLPSTMVNGKDTIYGYMLKLYSNEYQKYN